MPEMNKPMTLDEVQRLALQTGAALNVNGRTFNAGMESEPVPIRPQAQPEAEEEPAPASPSPAAAMPQGPDAIALAIAEAARINAAAVESALAATRPAAGSDPAKPKAWRMKARYDELGQFTTLICTSDTSKYRIDVKRDPATARIDDFVCYPIPILDPKEGD